MLKFGNKAPKRSEQPRPVQTTSHSPTKSLLGTSSTLSSGTQPPKKTAQRYSINSCIHSSAVASTFSRPAHTLQLAQELDHLDQLLAQAETPNGRAALAPSASIDSDSFVGDSVITISKKNTASKSAVVESDIRSALSSATVTEQVAAGIQNLSLLKHEDDVHTSSSRAKGLLTKTGQHTPTDTTAWKEAKEKDRDSLSSEDLSSSSEQADKKGSESGEDYSDDEDEGEDGYKVGGYHRVHIGDVYNQR